MNYQEITQACLESIRRHTREPYELILVDNGSTDGTVDYLRSQPDVILIENEENKGFAAGCNQGFERASGDYIMFLNNDTVVTDGWMTHLLRALNADPRIGMVGPVTNYSSGHQQIAVSYTNREQLDEFAKNHTDTYAEIYADVRRLIGFCMLTRRSVLEEVGLFDEIYGLGNYEDDDLCLRIIRKGYGLRVALDSFIHHVGHVTTNGISDSSFSQLMGRNAEIATEKWGGNIHQLIYKPELSIAACLMVLDAESNLRQTLDSLTDDFEKTIIVDLGSIDATAEIVQSYPVEFYSYAEASEKLHTTYNVFENTNSEYVLWLYQGDVLSDQDIRNVRSLKLTTEEKTDAIITNFNQKINRNEYMEAATRRFLFNRALAARKLSTILSGVSMRSGGEGKA